MHLENRILKINLKYQVCKRDIQDIRGVHRKMYSTNKFVQQICNVRKKDPEGSGKGPKYRHARREREKRPISDRLSKKEHRVDALALRADERRDKLRKAAGSCKWATIRRCLNGETHRREPPVSMRESITHGREPGELKHLSSRRKRKKNRFPKYRRAKWEEPKPWRVRHGV